jgi:hypothetical protein
MKQLKTKAVQSTKLVLNDSGRYKLLKRLRKKDASLTSVKESEAPSRENKMLNTIDQHPLAKALKKGSCSLMSQVTRPVEARLFAVQVASKIALQ